MELEDPLAFLKTKFNEDELIDKIEEAIKEYKGLISKDTAVKIIAKQNGYLVMEKSKISNIKKGMRSVNLEAEIINFFPIYEREGDNSFKCQRVMLKDDSGTIPLVFWNEDITILEKELSLGDKIEIIDAYENNGELNYAYKTKLNIKVKKQPTPINELKEGVCSVKGRIVEIFPDYLYVRDNEEKKMASFKLMDGKDQVRVIVWDNINSYKYLKEGDIIRIESGWFKNEEMHLNNSARVIVLEKAINPDVVIGEIQDIKLQNKELVILIQDKLLFLAENEILNFFGISNLSQDIELNTLFELKKDSIKNKEFSLEIKKEENKLYAYPVV